MRKTVYVLSFLMMILGTLAQAQFSLFPWYGKNKVHYDHFDWKVYSTEHFDIYFYTKETNLLASVVGILESAYAHYRSVLQHEIPFRIPVLYFRSQAEFQQLAYVDVSTSTLGVAEPFYNRVALTLDLSPEEMRHVIYHELAHIFEFSMVYGRLNINTQVQRIPPLWAMEGFAQFMAGWWEPTELMVVRDAVLTDRLPYISVTRDLEIPPDYGINISPYNIGHAVWEYVFDAYGFSGIREFWYQLRKSTYFSITDPFLSAFGVSEERFNEDFYSYLREKFEPFRKYETPLEYERIVALPFPYRSFLSYAMSPDGKLLAGLTINMYEQALDVVLYDRKSKKILNLTKGGGTKFSEIQIDLFKTRNLTWSGDGQYIAFFARTGKYNSLFVYRRNGKLFKKLYVPFNKATSPQFRPGKMEVSFVAFDDQNQQNIFIIDLNTKEIRQLTDDDIFEESPTWDVAGSKLIYVGRTFGQFTIYEFDVDEGRNRVLFRPPPQTFVMTPVLSPDGRYLLFASNYDQTIDLYRYDVMERKLYRMTKVMGGNYSPTFFQENGKTYIYFLSYFKGLNHLYRIPSDRVIGEVSIGEEIQREEVPEIPKVEIDVAQVRPKRFKPVLTNRPTFISGLTQDTVAFASYITLEDLLGEYAMSFFIQRIRSFNTIYMSWTDLSRRFQYVLEGMWFDDFFYAPVNEFFFGIVRNRQVGADLFGVYPIDIWRRIEFGAGFFWIEQDFLDDFTRSLYKDFIERTGTDDFLARGYLIPLTLAFTVDASTLFWFGPVSGYMGRIGISYSLPLGRDAIRQLNFFFDFRHYIRLGLMSLIAWRVQAISSSGDFPNLLAFGGGLDFRGYGYREIIANQAIIGHIELRQPMFPISWRIEHPWLNAFRWKLFFDAGVFRLTNLGNVPYLVTEELFDAEKGIGSFGIGITLFFAGFPLNLETAFITDFRKVSSKPRFNFSIGYDF